MYYLPDDMVLVHVGGNDMQPCIVTSWFVWWSDAAQRAHARSYLNQIVDNVAKFVNSLCGKPFKLFVIAEPPFSKYLPLAKLVSQTSLQRLREETEKMYAQEFASSFFFLYRVRPVALPRRGAIRVVMFGYATRRSTVNS